MNVRSSNRAPKALAEAIGATEENFVRMMNQKAQEMGLENTHFVNAVGYPTREAEMEHRTTALDHAKIVQALYRDYPEEMNELRIGSANLEGLGRDGQVKKFSIDTTNPFLPGEKFYTQNILGGKTGYACAAGSAIDTEALIEGRPVIIVTGGNATAAQRNNFVARLIKDPGEKFLAKLKESRATEAHMNMIKAVKNFVKVKDMAETSWTPFHDQFQFAAINNISGKISPAGPANPGNPAPLEPGQMILWRPEPLNENDLQPVLA